MQPRALSEGVHEGMYTRDQEVKAKAPEGKVGEEAEGLANSSMRLLDRIAADVDVFKLKGRSAVGEPCVAYDDRDEAVDAEHGANTSETEWRDKVRADEAVVRVEGGLRWDAPCFVGEDLHGEGRVRTDEGIRTAVSKRGC